MTVSNVSNYVTMAKRCFKIEKLNIPLRRCGGTEHAEEAEASSFLSSPLISGTLLVGKHGVAVRTLGSSSWSN